VECGQVAVRVSAQQRQGGCKQGNACRLSCD
jgi:hypothetical protein